MSISNTQKFIAHIRKLIAKGDIETAIQQLSALLKDSPLLDEAVQQSARYNNVMKQIRLGLVDFASANIAQNQIRYGVLELLREIEEQEVKMPEIKAEVERFAVKIEKNIFNNSTINAGGNATIGDTSITTQQNHSGTGDNVARDKITYKHISYTNRIIPRHLTTNPAEASPDLEFFGRKKELDDILFHFFPKLQRKGLWFFLKKIWLFSKKRNTFNSLKVLMLSGEGGIGKTTLAAQYFKLNEKRYAHVAWVLNEPDFSHALLKLAKRISLDLDEQDPIEYNMNILLADLADFPSPSLLIIDNMDNLNDLQISYPKLCALYNFHVIITSRITDFNQTNVYQIKGLAKGEVFDLFKRNYPAFRRKEKSLFNQIRKAVGDNTLVLELLSKNLEVINKYKTNYSLVNLHEDLQKKGLLHLSKSSSIVTFYHGHGELRSEKPEDIIAAMYNLGNLNEGETSLLSAFSVLPAAELVPLDLLHKLYAELPELETHLYTLTQKGWLEFVPQSIGFKCSPVIREVVRHINNTLREDTQGLINGIIYLLEYQSQSGLLLNASKEEALTVTGYGASILSFFQKPEYDFYKLYERMGNYHINITTGNLNLARHFFQQAALICQSLLDSNPEDVDFKDGLANSYCFLGITQTNLGNLDKALGFYEEYNRLAKELYAANPDSVELATSYQYLGITHTNLGDLDKALGFYEEYNRLAKELYAANPDNLSSKDILAISYQYLGITHTNLGNLDKALGFFKEMNTLFKEMYTANPDNVDFKNGLAIAHSKLGETHTSLGDLDKALGFYEECNRLAKELYEAYPNNVVLKKSLAIAYSQLGLTHTSLGSLDKALGFFKEMNTLFKEMYTASPDNVGSKNGLAISYEYLGIMHTDLDDLNKALGFYEECSRLAKELYDADLNNVEFKKNLAISYQYLGITHTNLGNLDKALGFYEELNKLFKEMYAVYSNNVNFKNGLAIAYQYLGMMHMALGNLNKALGFYKEMKTLFKEMYAAYPNNVDFKNGLAIAHFKLAIIYCDTDKEKEKINLKEAEKHLSELQELSPKNVQFKQTLDMVRRALSALD